MLVVVNSFGMVLAVCVPTESRTADDVGCGNPSVSQEDDVRGAQVLGIVFGEVEHDAGGGHELIGLRCHANGPMLEPARPCGRLARSAESERV